MDNPHNYGSSETRKLETISDPLVPLQIRKKLASEAIVEFVSLFDREMSVLCRLLRADPKDFSYLLDPEEFLPTELLPVLHRFLMREEDERVHLRACDVLAFRGDRTSVTPLSILLAMRGIGDTAANAAIDAFFMLSIRSPKPELHVFLRGLNAAKRDRSIAAQHRETISQISDVIYTRKRFNMSMGETLYWMEKNRPGLEKRFNRPKRRMEKRGVPGFVRARQTC
ncbi:hypothetical protein JW721_05875 [Candidatus Micrarchaeota archaeon]|nr:hypothetical protein [Candidatus Micrarchaeota archaeon]